jgi:hypothetical protein
VPLENEVNTLHKHVFLIDVTRHIGLAQQVVTAAQAYASKFKPELTEWFIKPAQAAGLDLEGASLHRVTDGTSPWFSIKARIDALASNGAADWVFHVLSYDGRVLGEATKLNGPALTISSLSLVALKDSVAPGTAEPRTLSPVPVHSRSIPLAEAIELTKRLLAERGYTTAERPLKQLFLRKFLEAEDPRAKKNFYDPASISLISGIVRDGLSKGWLAQSRQDGKSGTERIWLVTGPIPAPPPKIEAPAAVVPTPGTEILPPAAAEKGHERTVQMQACLKKRFVYSPKLIRDYIFAALPADGGDDLSQHPMTVSQLVREASGKAEQAAAADKVDYKFWPVAANSVLENLLAAGVLLDEKKDTIKPGPAARGTKVHGLKPDFVDACEAYLLEYLVQNLGDITWPRDRTAIAHALFKVGPSRKEVYELQERVDYLLVRLRDRVVEKEGGLLVVEK